MKKIFFAAISVLFLGNCVLLNPLGLSAGRYSGAETQDKVYTAALNGELMLTARLTGDASVNLRGLFYASIAEDLANVDGNKFYMKGSVDDCVASIEEASVITLAAPLETLADAREYKQIFAPSIVCDLEEDGLIIGKPLPKF